MRGTALTSQKIIIMAVYNQNQPNQVRNQANKKDKNLQRAGMVAAGVGLAGAATAFAATQLNDGDVDSDNVEMTSDDLLAGVNANAIETEEAPVAKTETTNHTTVENHVTHTNHETVHVYHHDAPHANVQGHEAGAAGSEPHVVVEESAILYDEEGNIISTYDAGTIDGKQFMVLDSDANGRGDVLAVDENRNGVFEEDEIRPIDNQTYEIGQGQKLNIYAKVGEDIIKVDTIDPKNDPRADYAEIQNDFIGDREDADNLDDFAHNNDDYNNHGGEQYDASMQHDPVPEYEPTLEVEPEVYAQDGLADPGYSDTYAYNDGAYEAAAGSYDAPESYELPEPGYEASASTYEAPETAYEAPETSYEAPDCGYADNSGADFSADTFDAGVDPIA